MTTLLQSEQGLFGRVARRNHRRNRRAKQAAKSCPTCEKFWRVNYK
jgi:hypothetical protein